MSRFFSTAARQKLGWEGLGMRLGIDHFTRNPSFLSTGYAGAVHSGSAPWNV